MADEPQETRRQKIKEWIDAHPEAPALAAMTFIVSAAAATILSSNKTQRNHDALVLKNNQLLADRNDKANVFARNEAAVGNVVHPLTNGGLLSIPADTPQKTHFV